MAKDTEKLIRQLSLISYLMAERRPVTALEIRRDVEGYSGMNEDAFARRFYADRAELLDWIRTRPLAHFDQGWLMVHAGVLPQWSCEQALALARELHDALAGPDWIGFLRTMYGNEPSFGPLIGHRSA